MAYLAAERSISSSIPASGQGLLADITADYLWSDNNLQYYLGNSATLSFDSEFRSDYNYFYSASSGPDSSYAYAWQTVRAFDMIDAVIATDFSRIFNESNAQDRADLVLVSSGNGSSVEGFNQFPGSSARNTNDYWSFGTISSDLYYMNISPELGGGEYLNWTIIHEIGHSIGLYHPFDGGGTLSSVGSAMDNERYTVMSYTDSSSGFAYGHAVTMMALDIAALQQQYGTETYAAGNSTYTLYDAGTTALRLDENNWDIGRAYASIWDSGGIDTIDYAGAAGSVLINLNTATLNRAGVDASVGQTISSLQNSQVFNSLSSNLQTEIVNPDYHAGGFFSQVLNLNGSTYSAVDGGFSIAYGAQIENATGGANADILIGNELGNTLTGGDGDDTLIGGAGNDTLNGGARNDEIYGDNGRDTLIGGGGDDILIGGSSEDDLRDVIYGGDGDDTIDGGYGNDELRGDAGDDTILGGFGGDRVIGGAGNDVLTGSALGDEIFGGDGFDFVNGGWGHDRVNGGSGGDSFFHIGIFDHGSDWIQDYNATEGDVLVFGNNSATAADFQVNFTHTSNDEGERSGDDNVQEAFVIYRPTEQIMWALVDGGGQNEINLQIGEQVFDLLA